MQMTTVPVSKSHENVLFLALIVNLGLIFSPLKGVMISRSLFQVAIEIVHRLIISCGMMLGVCMRGIKLSREKPAGTPFVYSHFCHCFCPAHTLWAKRRVLACLCRVCTLRFSCGILLVYTPVACSNSSTCSSCLHCCQVQICLSFSEVQISCYFWACLLASFVGIGKRVCHFLSASLICGVNSGHLSEVALSLLGHCDIIHFVHGDNSCRPFEPLHCIAREEVLSRITAF